MVGKINDNLLAKPTSGGVPYRLTQKEVNLIELLRQRKINYGTIACLLIYQDGEVVRVEMEPARESFKM